MYVFVIYGTQVHGSFQIIGALPNTVDDSNLESVTILNTSEISQEISGYILADLKKEYIFPEELFIEAWESQIFLRPETKLALNNTNEEIFLYNPERELVSSVSYKSSEKWIPLEFEVQDIKIDIVILEEPNDESLEDLSDEFEIIFDLQRPSYITQSGSSDTYLCDSGEEECKVNFNLEVSFWDIFKKWDYRCELDFWWVWETELEKCNPNTVIFPEWETDVIFRVIEKDTEQEFALKTINILFDRSLPSFDEVIQLSASPKLALRKPDIIVQSGLSWQGTNFYCIKQPCKINLDYKNLHTGAACFWDFWPGTTTSMTTRERCNPGYVTMPEWSFTLYLRVYEKAFPSNRKTLKYFIHNIPEEEIIAQDIILASESVVEEEIIQNINTNIVVQGTVGKEKTLSWNLLVCSDVEECFVNFTADWIDEDEGVRYSWTDNEEDFSQDINPKWVWFEQWEHNIVFQTTHSGAILDTQKFYISVTWKIEKEIVVVPKIIKEEIFTEPALFTSEEEKKETSEFLLPKWAFTQNYLVLKYDGLRISGKAPLWVEIEVFHEWKLVVSGTSDEKWKYRLVSKDFLSWEYGFVTKLILESGEEVLIESTKTAKISPEQITLWKTPKKKSTVRKSSTSNTYQKVSPSLILKNPLVSQKETIEELSLSMKVFLSVIICLSTIFAFLHLILTSAKRIPSTIFSLYWQRFLIKQKVCLIL